MTFVIKLRIVRFCARPSMTSCSPGDPTWVTGIHWRDGRRRPALVTKTSFRFLQTLYNLGPGARTRTSPSGIPRACRQLPQIRAKVAIDTERAAIRERLP
jgi:formate C-acetyltransferase